MARTTVWTPERILEAIQAFAETYGRVPEYADFDASAGGLPSRTTLEKHWHPWEDAVRAAGLLPAPRRPPYTPRMPRLVPPLLRSRHRDST